MKKVLLAVVLVFGLLLSAYAATYTPVTYPKFRAYKPGTSTPLVGGQLYTYTPGTTIPVTTYKDVAGVSQNTNPIILDANGEAALWYNGYVKLVLYDSTGVVVWTQDNYPASVGGIAGGGSIFDNGITVTGDASISGTTTTGTLEVTGNAVVQQQLAAGEISVDNLSVQDNLTAVNTTTGTLTVTGATPAVIPVLSVTEALTAEDITSITGGTFGGTTTFHYAYIADRLDLDGPAWHRDSIPSIFGTDNDLHLFFSPSLDKLVIALDNDDVACTISKTGVLQCSEIWADQFGSTCIAADNTCGTNSLNAGPPADNTAGTCGFDNTANAYGCWGNDGVFQRYGAGEVTSDSSTVFTNKTLDANATGNVLKQTKYLDLGIPQFKNGTSAVYDNTYHFVTFSASADKAQNCAVWYTYVPEDFDNTVELAAKFVFERNGTDNATHAYEIKMCVYVEGEAMCGSPGTSSLPIAMTHPGSLGSTGAGIIGWTTLTGWSAATTPGDGMNVVMCRDGDAAGDASTVTSNTALMILRYGSVQ